MSVYFFYDVNDSAPFYYLTPTRMAGQLPPPYDTSMSPNDYLEFAIADFREDSQRGLLNAFGNVKRALHFSTDILLQQYGLFKHFGRTNFPGKLRLLDEVGILPINIMENLNVERNLIEHQYEMPPKQRVAEAIDVVKLLLLASEKLLESTPHEAVIGWRKPRRHAVLQLEPFHGLVNIFTLRAPGKYRTLNGVTCFAGPLRNFGGGKLARGITMPKTPWKVLTLNRNTMSGWKPIIAELVNIQRMHHSRRTHVDKGQGQVTISVTVPLPDLPQRSWADLLDEFLDKKMSDRDSPQKPEQSEHGGSRSKSRRPSNKKRSV